LAAFATTEDRFHGHRCARPPFHALGDGVNRAADLVARLKTGWRTEVAPVKLKVRAADAGGGNARANLSGGWSWNGGIDDLPGALGVPNGSFHGVLPCLAIVREGSWNTRSCALSESVNRSPRGCASIRGH